MTPDTWAVGPGYEQYIGRWSRPVAASFVTWLGLPEGLRWLDVGCGTGALTATVLATGKPAEVVGVDPSEGFVAHARAHVAGARFVVSDARSLPFADGRFEVAACGLVLNFVPEPRSAAAELVRVVGPGGTVAGYVWDYAEGMELIRRFWAAAADLDPAAAELDEARRFPLCHPQALHELWVGSGLADVAVRPIDVPTLFSDFDDYWSPFLGGQGPAPGYVMSLAEDHRAALRELLRARLRPGKDGSIPLTARAWAVRGIHL